MDKAQAEEILLDEDVEAAGHSFWDLGDLQVGVPAEHAAGVGHQAVSAAACGIRLASPRSWNSTAFACWSMRCAEGIAVATCGERPDFMAQRLLYVGSVKKPSCMQVRPA